MCLVTLGCFLTLLSQVEFTESALVSLKKISFLKYIHIGTGGFNKTESSFDKRDNHETWGDGYDVLDPSSEGELDDQTSYHKLEGTWWVAPMSSK